MPGTTRAILVLASAVGLLLAASASGSGRDFRAGSVYTLTNAATGNAVAVFGRGNDGTLQPEATYPTGGNGGGERNVIRSSGRLSCRIGSTRNCDPSAAR